MTRNQSPRSKGRQLTNWMLAVACVVLTRSAVAVEHPGTLPADALCSSCHIDKISGKSVHSAMTAACTVCHVARTQGDMTEFNLSMPKAQICFACHEKTVQMVKHSSSGKETCLGCHDAHSSNGQMLLIVDNFFRDRRK